MTKTAELQSTLAHMPVQGFWDALHRHAAAALATLSPEQFAALQGDVRQGLAAGEVWAHHAALVLQSAEVGQGLTVAPVGAVH